MHRTPHSRSPLARRAVLVDRKHPTAATAPRVSTASWRQRNPGFCDPLPAPEPQHNTTHIAQARQFGSSQTTVGTSFCQSISINLLPYQGSITLGVRLYCLDLALIC